MRSLALLVVFALSIGAACLYFQKRPAGSPSAARGKSAYQDHQSVAPHRPPASCGAPLYLHAGVIDPQFSLGPAQVESIIAAAAREWQDATGRQWFVVSAGKGVPVNFLYDGRQSDLQADASQRAELEAELARARKSSPMPPEALGALLERVERYRVERHRLLKPVPWAQHVRLAGTESIDIFAFSDTDQLHATLLHELGHALGLDHLPQPEAIMHELREVAWSDIHLSQYDTEAALSLCERR